MADCLQLVKSNVVLTVKFNDIKENFTKSVHDIVTEGISKVKD